MDTRVHGLVDGREHG